MTIGAIITAAGASSRMGDFKPLMNIGSLSISQRIVTTLKQAGTELIVVVTGYRADDLEHHLAQSRIIFLRNDRYENSEMFDSALIGLDYLHDKCSRIIFTPVDIPLFTVDTVAALLKNTGDVAIPVCAGQSGHPIGLSPAAARKILHYDGHDGLRGALQQCGPMDYIPVEDYGILHDADTPADYRALLAYHNYKILRPELDIKLSAEKIFFDSRMAMLLFLIDHTSSVLSACRQMQISYSAAWKLLNTSEAELGFPLVKRLQGGPKGSQTKLTPEGSDLLNRYRKFTVELREHANTLYDKYFGDVFQP